MSPRRRRLLFSVVLAFSLVGAQWLLGRAPAGGACSTGKCLAPVIERF